MTKDQLKGIFVPTPPINEQERIVALIRELFSLTSLTRVAAKKVTEQSDIIDQAVLAKAFRGELVPQDPNDKSASTLLEHMRAAYESTKGRQRKLSG